MTWYPISYAPTQYMDSSGTPYSGAVLKAYAEGTTTPLNMATDSTGGTTAASFALNANGYPESGGAMIIPHIEQNYKLSLYPTQAAADSDSGAVWTIDNIKITGSGSSSDSDLATGDVIPTFKSSARSGFLLLNKDTIGSAASGADHNGASYQDLFEFLWNNLADTYAPVSSGRGASASADWAADKTLTLPDGRGRSFVGSGVGDGLSKTWAHGGTDGAENKTLAEAELPSHSHASGTLATSSTGGHSHGLQDSNDNDILEEAGGSNSVYLLNFSQSSSKSNTAPQLQTETTANHTHTITGSTASTGSGTAFSLQDPAIAGNWMIKL